MKLNKILNKIFGVLVILTVVLAIIIYCYSLFGNDAETIKEPYVADEAVSFDAKNATYEINGAVVTLQNGVNETEIAPDSATKIITKYFGNEARGDLNSDGREDMAFLITQDTGGTGLFYYVVAIMKTDIGYKPTNAFLVGDRIAPQTTEIHSDSMELRVNYAERKPNEPMTAQPSMGATLFLKVTADGVLTGLMT